MLLSPNFLLQFQQYLVLFQSPQFASSTSLLPYLQLESTSHQYLSHVQAYYESESSYLAHSHSAIVPSQHSHPPPAVQTLQQAMAPDYRANGHVQAAERIGESSIYFAQQYYALEMDQTRSPVSESTWHHITPYP